MGTVGGRGGMGPEAVRSSSIDWSHEALNSLIWVLQAFSCAALGLVVAVLLLGRTTAWGRQFGRITGGYFRGRQSVPAWLSLAALLVSAVVAVRVAVLESYYANDLFAALQTAFEGGATDDAAVRAGGVDAFWRSIGIFVVLATVSAVRYLVDLYVYQRFVLRWRVWLSRRFVDDWLDEHAYFRGALSARPIDNPDQRIQQDVDVVTAGTGEVNSPANGSVTMLAFGSVQALLSVVSFGVILWQLSGPLTVLGVTVPKALFCIVIGYVLVATVIAFWIGRPLIGLSFLNEVRNASFRYAMIRLKDSAAAVGLYRGEPAERVQLRDRLAAIVANYRQWLHRMLLFLGWNVTVSQAINPLPYVVQAQRLFAGQISLGDVMQSAAAFIAIHDSLSYFRNAYDSFAAYRAALLRLDGLRDGIARADALPRLAVGDSADGGVHLAGVEVKTPQGTTLVRDLGLDLAPGDTLVVRGRSGVGKTVLLQSLAGLWPYATGDVRMPNGAEASPRDALFVSQLPYLPLGDLRAAVAYPLSPDQVSDADVQRALVAVSLPHLVIRIREVRDWGQSLSVGEQQRLAFARILLVAPAVVFLDEATSAMDEGLEMALYHAIRTALPSSIVVSVSHRETVDRHHDQQLELLGDGEWRLRQVPATT